VAVRLSFQFENGNSGAGPFTAQRCQLLATWNKRHRPDSVAHVVPEHLEGVRSRKLNLIAKTEAVVKDRFTKEISYWDHRAGDLKLRQ